jgi:hypothetical protein
MGNKVRVLRIVVASPGDVTAEREAVPGVIEEINQSIAADRGLRLEVVRWETDAFPGLDAEGPQGLVDKLLQITDSDVLVGIFWRRFGTPTNDAQSGTAHEFRIAYEAWQKNSRPQVMCYFKQASYTPQSREETDQWGQVLEFKKAFPREGLWWPYKGTAQFAALLRKHLTKFIRARYPLPVGMQEPSLPIALRAGPTDYFAVQSKIIGGYTRTFVGRAYAREVLEQFLRKYPRGYLIVRGGPGQGKTAFACHLVETEGYAHHFISRTGSRTDPRLILCSLLSQLLPLLGNGGALPEAISELTKTFEELLTDVTGRQKKLVIVIDALDELPPDDDMPPYLVTEALPNGVYYVVTSRDGDLVERLQERLFGIPHQLYDLGPLNLAETDEILRAQKTDITAAEVERIADVSQGNPLYLRAVVDELESNPAYDLRILPDTVEGFFRNAMNGLRAGNTILGETLGCLSVARTSLSAQELSHITGHPQRQVDEQGIRPIRQFLFEVDGHFSLYHTRFHEFVIQSVLYEEELRDSHRKIAEWLDRPENRDNEYRWASLAHHLFESGSREQLTRTINDRFLAEKLRRLGYAVLEDVELLARCLLDMDDPAVVRLCVGFVERLRESIGGDIIPHAVKAIQTYRAEPRSLRPRVFAPVVPSIPALDAYVAVVPQAEVAADFFEFIPLHNRLVVAIGDAPSLGLKSAFVARFIGNLFRKLVQNSTPLQLTEVLAKLNATLRDHDYFERVSMQCIEFDPGRGVLRIANAGHPYPVHYSARRGKCDILPVQGSLLHNPLERVADRYEEYSLTIGRGDIVVLVTDGLTESHVILGDPYGYRFMATIEGRAAQSAQSIGEAILDSWRAHPREEDYADDVSVVVVGVR